MSTKRKDSANGEHQPPDSTTKEKPTFCIGDEVLMQRKDGNFYLGTVVKIDLSREQCQVKFGDNTETWSSFTRLTKLLSGLEIMCVKCKTSQSDNNNEIIVCDKCSRGYHQKCHNPVIGDEFLKEDAKWECIRCCDVPSKRTLPLRKSTAPQQTAQQTTPQSSPQLKPSAQQKNLLPPKQANVPKTTVNQAKPTAQTKPVPSPQLKVAPSPQPKVAPSPQPKVAPPQPKVASPQPKVAPSPQPKVAPTPQPKVAPPQPKISPSPQLKVSLSPQPKVSLSPQLKQSPPPPPPPPSNSVQKQPSLSLAKQTPNSKLSFPSLQPKQIQSTSLQPKLPSPSQVTESLPLSVSKPSSPPLSKSSSLSPPLSTPSSSKQSLQSEPSPIESKSPLSSLAPSPATPSTSTQPPPQLIPVATEAQKKKLPYNLNDLHWDMQHRSNTENKYCYCGGPGKWFLKMLQCGRCRQWFHGRCLASLRYPLFYGDRFYVFLCTHCNSGKEFLRRLEIKWVDLVHLAVFNLTLKGAKKYQDIDDDILKFINTSWNELQLPPKILETNDSEKREIILSVLTSNRNRFKCAREVKIRKTKWGLRVRVPPLTPVFSLPPNKPLSDQVLSDAWNNSARLKFLPPPPRNLLPLKPEDDFDLSNLKDQLPGVDILHIETRLLVLPKGVPASGHNVCIKSSTPMYPESRAIKRRIQEQGMENDRLRRSRKARRLLRSSLNKDRGEGKEGQDLPPTPPSSESNPEVANAQPDTSGDETSSRGTLDSIIPPPVDFEGQNNPFLPLAPVLRPVKRRLSEKDIVVTSTGEVKRRKVRRSMKHSARGLDTANRGKVKKLKPPTPTSSPVKNQSSFSLDELKNSVNQYFGAVNRIASGEKFTVRAKRITLDGRTQYLIDWGTPS